jgi:hypothetical protein
MLLIANLNVQHQQNSLPIKSSPEEIKKEKSEVSVLISMTLRSEGPKVKALPVALCVGLCILADKTTSSPHLLICKDGKSPAVYRFKSLQFPCGFTTPDMLLYVNTFLL